MYRHPRMSVGIHGQNRMQLAGELQTRRFDFLTEANCQHELNRIELNRIESSATIQTTHRICQQFEPVGRPSDQTAPFLMRLTTLSRSLSFSSCVEPSRMAK